MIPTWPTWNTQPVGIDLVGSRSIAGRVWPEDFKVVPLQKASMGWGVLF